MSEDNSGLLGVPREEEMISFCLEKLRDLGTEVAVEAQMSKVAPFTSNWGTF